MGDMAIAELRPRKITVDEYHRMADAGILRRQERVELIDGIIVEMSPIGPPHGGLHGQIVEYLNRLLAAHAKVLGQFTLPLGEFSEPQPDIGVFAYHPTRYLARYPTVEETFALIEIADSSISTDAGKKRELYARFSIREYLIADIANRRLLRFTKPITGQYTATQQLSYGDRFALEALPELTLDADPFLPVGTAL